MPEDKKEVKTFIVDMICEDCHKGFIEYTGSVKCCYPPLYEHACTNCGKNKDLKKRYPITSRE